MHLLTHDIEKKPKNECPNMLANGLSLSYLCREEIYNYHSENIKIHSHEHPFILHEQKRTEH